MWILDSLERWVGREHLECSRMVACCKRPPQLFPSFLRHFCYVYFCKNAAWVRFFFPGGGLEIFGSEKRPTPPSCFAWARGAEDPPTFLVLLGRAKRPAACSAARCTSAPQKRSWPGKSLPTARRALFRHRRSRKKKAPKFASQSIMAQVLFTWKRRRRFVPSDDERKRARGLRCDADYGRTRASQPP